MDIVSHALVGRALVTSQDKRFDRYLVSFFGALPDVFQIPLYMFVGRLHDRPFYFPQTSDWTGVRAAYPGWSLWWDIPHSLFFLLLVVTPAVLLLKLNKLAIAAYALHLFLDLFTHTGEWGLMPFFPFSYKFSGFTDAWAWDYPYFVISWAVLIACILLLEKYRVRVK